MKWDAIRLVRNGPGEEDWIAEMRSLRTFDSIDDALEGTGASIASKTDAGVALFTPAPDGELLHTVWVLNLRKEGGAPPDPSLQNPWVEDVIEKILGVSRA